MATTPPRAFLRLMSNRNLAASQFSCVIPLTGEIITFSRPRTPSRLHVTIMSPQSNFFEFPEPEDLIIRRNELREELPHWLFVVVDWLLTTKGPGPGKPHLMTPWWVTAWVGDVQAFMIFTPFLVIATMVRAHHLYSCSYKFTVNQSLRCFTIYRTTLTTRKYRNI